MSTSPYFCLYAHNLPVRGATRSAVYDLHRQGITLIPNVLHAILLDFRHRPWAETQQQFAPGNPALFGHYLDFLQAKELGFFTRTPADFPALSLRWHSPHHVQNAVLSYAFGQYSLPDVLAQLDGLQCRHLELRLTLGHHAWAEVVALFQQLEPMGFQSVTLLLTYSEALPDEPALGAFYEQFPKIQCIIVHSAPGAYQSPAYPGKLAFVAQNLPREQPRTRHIVNLEYFTEAQQFNPYYHRKICVSESGSIKNCLLLPQRFGNVNTTPLAAALANPAFQELWHAAPDQTVGLRDSELRYAHFSADYLVKNPASGLFDVEHRVRPLHQHPATIAA